MGALAYRARCIEPDNRREPKTQHYCARCHRDLKVDQRFRIVHLVDGGPFALHRDDEALYDNPSGDLGWFAVGMDCARAIGDEYTSDGNGWFMDALAEQVS